MAPLSPTCVLAVDAVILTVEKGTLRLLVHERRHEPFAGRSALPGVLVLEGESEIQAVRRVLSTKVNGADVYLSQVATFAEPGRDPRGRVVSVAWGALVSKDAAASLCSNGLRLVAVDADGLVAGETDGSPLSLAFDHGAMVSRTVRWLREGLRDDLTGAEMLGGEFTLRDLQEVYEAVYGRSMTASNFHAFVQSRGLVVPTGRKAESTGRGRPGMLYRAAPRPATPWEA